MAEQTADLMIEETKKITRVSRNLFWVILGVSSLLFFTLVKLPDVKIKAYVQNSISNALAPYGIILTARETDISIFTGLSYTMKKVMITFPSSPTPVLIDEIEVAPSVLPLLTGKLAVDAFIQAGKGEVSLSVVMKQPAFDIDFDMEDLDLNRLGILANFAKIKGSGILSADGSLSGNMNDLQTLSGEIEAKAQMLTIDEQSIFGFNVPKLVISDSEIELNIKDGVATASKVQIGKPGSRTDAVVAKVTGSVKLSQLLSNSMLDLTAEFQLTEEIHKAFFLIDALLSPGKKADGSYAFKLTGPLSFPISTPLGGK